MKKWLVLFNIFLFYGYAAHGAAAGRYALQKIAPTFARTFGYTVPATYALVSSRRASNSQPDNAIDVDKQTKELIEAEARLAQAESNLIDAVLKSGKLSPSIEFLMEETPKLLEKAKESGHEGEIEIRDFLAREYEAIALEMLQKSQKSFWKRAAKYFKTR